MILGRGTACTDEAICAEYTEFLQSVSGIDTARVRNRVAGAASTMCRRIDKPIVDWTEEDVRTLLMDRCKAVVYGYCAFLAFLIFRGYFPVPHIAFLAALPLGLGRMHRPALLPIRQRLEATRQTLGYAPEGGGAQGRVLTLLIYLLAIVGKPLDELTRVDFDAFRTRYDQWYQEAGRRADGLPDARLTRLERYLVHWGVLPPPRVRFKHEEHFAALRHEAIQQAILVYMRWCEAKYQPSTIHSCRAAVMGFFLWLQGHYPHIDCLDGVSRALAVAYATALQRKVEEGTYSAKYRSDLYRRIRLFYEFAITERLATSPDRNPFALGDTPANPDPLPRYLTDGELQTILRYCAREGTLLERVVVTTLLHTGLRACELVKLKATDIVQIQGSWKLHIHEGKGLKDRILPLTQRCLDGLCEWQTQGWERVRDELFTTHGRPWAAEKVGTIIRTLGHKLNLAGLTPHRFRHTFAVALLNYGMRESALQKLMGHKTLNMTLEYARILDQSVEHAFSQAVNQMQEGPLSWVPNFFQTEDYTLFAEGDTVSWIRLPHGYCRRNPKLHCESDVKCLLCDRYCASAADLSRLQEMHERFVRLGLQVKADVVAAQIRRLQALPSHTGEEIPLQLR